MSNAGTPTPPRLPKPAVEPQIEDSTASLSSFEARVTLDEPGEEKRAANEFITGTRVC